MSSGPLFFSAQGILFSELCPAKVRYTGLSVGYQVAAAIVGFGPMFWTSMAEAHVPSPWVFGGFMMAGVTVSLILILFTNDTRKVSSYQDSDKSVGSDKAVSI